MPVGTKAEMAVLQTVISVPLRRASAIPSGQNDMAMNHFKNLLERSAFGVCSYLGEKIGVASARVRMYFIYLSFATLGSPVIFYLFVAFWLNVRNYIKQKRSPMWN